MSNFARIPLQASPHHARFHAWAADIGRTNLRTCALTELGFIRVSMQVFGYTRQQAAAELSEMKKGIGFVEHAPSPKLPHCGYQGPRSGTNT